MNKSAFTSTERVVATAVFAVVAGSALTLYAMLMDKVRCTRCMNSMKTIGIATIAYLADHDDQFFQAGDDWPTLLQTKYVPDWDDFHSAFDKNEGASTRVHPVSYGINENLFAAKPGQGSRNPFTGSMAELASPSELIMFAPCYQGDPTKPGSWTNRPGAVAPVKTGGSGMAKGTYSGGQKINVVYADSHIARTSFQEFQETTDRSPLRGVDGTKQWWPQVKRERTNGVPPPEIGK